MFAPRLPEYDRECGSRRLYELVEYLRSDGCDVTYVALDDRPANRYLLHLRRNGVACYTGLSDTNLDQLITAAQFDVAVLAFWHAAEGVMPRLRRLSPRTRIVIDSIDLHFLRQSRRAYRAEFGLLDATFADEMARELNTYAAADLVLTVSQKEADLVNDLLADAQQARAVPLCEDMEVSPVRLADRRGMLFVGNFWHAPNVEAAEFFCRQVFSRISKKHRSAHPLDLVGHALDDRVKRHAQAAGADVRVVGWVPTLMPYFHRARVSVVPLLHGAGTKGKLLQALMAGTPTVSTTIGVEGLNLRSGTHLLVADDAATFAAAVERLLADDALSQQLATAARGHVAGQHDRKIVGERFLQEIAGVLGRAPKGPMLSDRLQRARSAGATQQVALRDRVDTMVETYVPAGETVMVVSKGDAELVRGNGHTRWHYPQAANGDYAGFHPADSAQAITQLELLRSKGANFLLLPEPSIWWLNHYPGLRQHLVSRYALLSQAKEVGVLFDVRGPSVRRLVHSARALALDVNHDTASSLIGGLMDAFRPAASGLAPRRRTASRKRTRVLVIGIYMGTEVNTASDIVRTLSSSSCDVTQKWVALGQPATDPVLAKATVQVVPGLVPKFTLLADLLAQQKLADYDYLLITDDDVVFPREFSEHFFEIQARLGFAIAQPARTSNSFIDHPIVEQQRGVLARRTQFVEIGPVVSVHRSAFDLVLPFDLASPMGWGFEQVWAYLAAKRRLPIGIIDALPVDHSLRPVNAHYTWSDADRNRAAYLARHEHLALEHCFHVHEVYPVHGATR